jgi:murein L,D-transpeptidase YcbB/YkuD
LAEWVLEGQDGWTRDRIVAAMNGSRPQAITLARPIQVILFYVTAVVMPDDGTIRFADDIYGHDRRLDTALSQPDRRDPPVEQ